jgi:glucose 1-dehydrogenase
MATPPSMALITGAAGGIGRACALALAAAGNDLILNDRPGNAQLAQTARAVEALGRVCHLVEADVFTAADRERLVTTATRWGPIRILVSNPALNVRQPFLEIELEKFERVLAGTLTSGFHLGQLVARTMIGGGGRIIFMSSVLAQMPFAHNAAYAAAKAALNQLARVMAVELATHRISVNTVEPGWIATPGERALTPTADFDQASKQLPWGRMGTPEDVANLVAFLASDGADYITGAAIPVDGGFRFKDLR